MSIRLSNGRRKGKSKTPYKYYLTIEQIIRLRRWRDERLEQGNYEGDR